MKFQEIIFRHPVKVIQVFRNIHEYDKTMKSFEDRKEDMTWREIPSTNGHIIGHELFLPETILQNPKLVGCNLVIITDENPKTTNASVNRRDEKGGNFSQCFSLTTSVNPDIFKLKNKEGLELFLEYGYFTVGTPERENFKLCDIEKNRPVEIKINGKTDASLTSRRERIFKEQYYIYDYVGDFEKCLILKEPLTPIIKQVPLKRKVVDLLKPLW